MTRSIQRSAAASFTSSQPQFRNKLMFAASAGILALVVPGGVYGTRANAQSIIPDECTDTNPNDPNNPNVGNGLDDNGETLTCLSNPAGNNIGTVRTTADNLTVIIGQAGAGVGTTRLVGQNPELSMAGAGTQTLRIEDSARVQSSSPNPIIVNVKSSGNVDITNAGQIRNTSNAGERKSLKAEVEAGGGDLIIDSSTGLISGAVDIDSLGSGNVDLKFGDIQNSRYLSALDVNVGASVKAVDIEVGTIAPEFADSVNGLVFQGANTGDTNIDVTGPVTGATGVSLTQTGASNTTVELTKTGSVTGVTADGVFLDSTAAQSSATIKGTVDPTSGTRYGSIVGKTDGIDVRTNGGAITIQDLAKVNGETTSGMTARSNGGKVTIQNVTEINSKDGAAIIADTRQEVTKIDPNNIPYTAFEGGADISIQNVSILEFDDDGLDTTVDIRSANGIRAFSGTGNINIGALNNADANLIGSIIVEGTGILADSEGGNIDIRSGGRVVGGTGQGINARTAGGGTITIDTLQGAYSNSVEAIRATSSGSGAITLNLQGEATGAVGVFAGDANPINPSNTGKISLNLGANALVSGNRFGAFLNAGAGGSTIEPDVIVTGTSTSKVDGGEIGLLVTTKGAEVQISDLDEVRGGNASTTSSGGIVALTDSGAVSIRNIGSITSETGAAIDVDTSEYDYNTQSYFGGADISIQNIAIPKIADGVYSNEGIVALSGTGAINIGAQDPDNGTGIGNIYSVNAGIYARSDGGPVNVHVDGNTVNTGNFQAVAVYNYGSNSASIELEAVTSRDSSAVYVNNGINSTDLTLTVNGAVTADAWGLDVYNYGSGKTTVTASGPINAAVFDGINVFSEAADVAVTSSQSISAGGIGIDVDNRGSGASEITARGQIDADSIAGILLNHDSTGAALINALGKVSSGGTSGTIGAAISAKNTGGASLTINAAGELDGYQHGIWASSDTGSLSITKTGTGPITGRYDDGIRALTTGPAATTLDISLESAVIGSKRGVYIAHAGSGMAKISFSDFSASITGQTSDGIKIENSQAGASILVQGKTYQGNPSLYGSVAGAVHGMELTSAGADITVRDLASVSGGTGEGIYASSGGGKITIENIGSVTSQSLSAVALHAVSGTGDIEITNVGIPIFTPAPSSLIDQSYRGIGAYSLGGNITIETDAAIYAYGYGVTAKNGLASSPVSSGAIDIKVGDVSVQSTGVSAYNFSDAAASTTSVTVSGNVTGGFYGIYTSTVNGAHVTVTETGSVYGVTRAVDFNSALGGSANDKFTLNGGVTNDVVMGFGDDTFEYAGTIGSGSTVFGGTGTDTVSITSTAAKTLTNSGGSTDAIQEFEILNFDGDNAVLAGEHVGWQQANFRQGTTSIAESAILRATTATIFAGATLNARDGSSFEGNLINSGRLEIGSSPGRFNLIGDFTQGTNGVLPIEYDGATGTGDFLFVSGEATLDGTLELQSQNVPTEVTNYLFLQALGGISGEFSVLDGVPDIDYAVIFSNSGTTAELGPVAIVPDPDPDPDAGDGSDMGDSGDGSDTGDGGDDPDMGDTGGSDGGGTGDGSDPTDPVAPVEPDPEPAAPLLSPKELVPSALMAGMFASDLFADSLIQRRSETMSPGEWSFWTTGLGGRYDVGNSAGQTGWEGGNSGFAFGAQHLFEQNGAEILFGLSTGFTEADLDSSISHGKVDSLHLGGFVNAQIDGLFLAAAASHAWQDYDLQRVFVMGDGQPVVTRAETEGKASSFKTKLHYDLLWSSERDDGLSLGPVLTADFTTGTYNRFKESGAGILNLTYEEETAQQAVIGAGGEGRYETTLFGDTRVDTGVHLLWENLSGDLQINSRASLIVPDANFAPSSAKLDTSRAAIGADAKIYFSDKIYGHIRYDTTRSKNFTDHEGWAGITVKF